MKDEPGTASFAMSVSARKPIAVLASSESFMRTARSPPPSTGFSPPASAGGKPMTPSSSSTLAKTSSGRKSGPTKNEPCFRSQQPGLPASNIGLAASVKGVAVIALVPPRTLPSVSATSPR
jgi:hypothetical protein